MSGEISLSATGPRGPAALSATALSARSAVGHRASLGLCPALLLSVISRPDPRDWTRLPALDLRLDEALAWAERRGAMAGRRIGLLPSASCLTRAAAPRRAGCPVSGGGDDERLAAAGADVVALDPFLTPEWLRQVDEFWRVRSLVELEGLGTDTPTRVLPFVRRWAEAAGE